MSFSFSSFSVRQKYVGALCIVFTVGFMCVFIGLIAMTFFNPPSNIGKSSISAPIPSPRADIVDRTGNLIATSLPTYALSADPSKIIDPISAADELVKIFPSLDRQILLQGLQNKDRHILEIKNFVSPIELQMLRIPEGPGIPGLIFKPSPNTPKFKRSYPHGKLFSHPVGFTNSQQEAVSGLEKFYDRFLRTQQSSLVTSLDITVQYTLHQVLSEQINRFQASNGNGLIMDVRNGEILAMVSLPDFDPHILNFNLQDMNYFNQTIQGVYEMGSVFKIINTSLALESGYTGDGDKTFDVSNPIQREGYPPIVDFVRPFKDRYNIREIFVYSSNIGSARLALDIGWEEQKNFFERVGLRDQMRVDLENYGLQTPQIPLSWQRDQADKNDLMVLSFGYSLSLSPLHFATIIAGIINGGILYPPTFIKHTATPREGYRIVKPETSKHIIHLLRDAVTSGTSKGAQVPGYWIGGKTGTADMVIDGKYDKNKQRCSFIGIFPIENPSYLVFLLIEDPKPTTNVPFMTGGNIVAPVMSKVVERIAPILGIPAFLTPKPQQQLSEKEKLLKERMEALRQMFPEEF